MSNVTSLFYTVEEIKEMEKCGRDRAYEIARSLPHKRNGKGKNGAIRVYKQAYDNYAKEQEEKAIQNISVAKEDSSCRIRKFS